VEQPFQAVGRLESLLHAILPDGWGKGKQEKRNPFSSRKRVSDVFQGKGYG
jgi:hypothetical protein